MSRPLRTQFEEEVNCDPANEANDPVALSRPTFAELITMICVIETVDCLICSAHGYYLERQITDEYATRSESNNGN
jgi:hypothetical protein